MSHFIYPVSWGGATAPALWSPTAADFTLLGVQGYKSINGDQGGAWAPAAAIDVGGLGLRARLRYDLIAAHPDTNTSWNCTVNRLVIADATMTAPRTASMLTTNALLGDVIRFDSETTQLLTIKDDAGATLITIGTSSSADSTWAELRFNGTHWKLHGSARVANRIVALDSFRLATTQTGGGAVAAFTDIPGTGLGFTCAAGDKLEISFAGGFVDATAGTLAVAITDGGVETQAWTSTSGTAWRSLAAAFSYTVVNAGTVTVNLQWKGSANPQLDGANTLGAPPCEPASMRVTQIRP